jgi:shikimate dehydrogenase
MVILARSEEKRERLQNDLIGLFPDKRISSFPLEKNDLRNTRSLLINTTPLGMNTGNPLPYPTDALPADWIIADLVYRPLKTPFLCAAEKSGLQIIPGMGMLLHQAVLAFEIFTKQKAPIEAMRKALSRVLV